MRKFNKILFLTIFVIFLSVLKIYAAESADVQLNANCTEVKIGDIITIDVIARCENGIEGLDSTLNWDKTKLQFINQSSVEDASLSGEDSKTGKFKLSFIVNSANPVTEKKFTTLEFKVLEGVQEGDTLNISLSDIDFQDSKESDIEMDNKNVTVKVAGNLPSNEDEEKPSENPENKPNENTKEKADDKNKTEKDNTIANKTMDKSGIGDYVAPITLISIIAIISLIGIRKYKNI